MARTHAWALSLLLVGSYAVSLELARKVLAGQQRPPREGGHSLRACALAGGMQALQSTRVVAEDYFRVIQLHAASRRACAPRDHQRRQTVASAGDAATVRCAQQRADCLAAGDHSSSSTAMTLTATLQLGTSIRGCVRAHQPGSPTTTSSASFSPWRNAAAADTQAAQSIPAAPECPEGIIQKIAWGVGSSAPQVCAGGRCTCRQHRHRGRTIDDAALMRRNRC